VVSIIFILMGLMAGVLGVAKEAGQRGMCIANARTIETLLLVGVPAIYIEDYGWPYSSPYEGKLGYVDVGHLSGRRDLVLFVNCFDCHDASDPFEPVHELVAIN
jgi:hypothetical protein